MEEFDSFGEWLRQRRSTLSLTRPELAECAGCSVSALRKIEADERRPSRQLAKLLADCLRIPREQQAIFLDAARGVRRVTRLDAHEPRPAATSEAQPVNFAGAIPGAPPGGRVWNLPSSITPLIGREAELEALRQLLGDPACRLLTLVGPGGIGKTRLAVDAACDVWKHFTDGVFFASLASISSREYLAPAIAHSVGLNLSGPADPREQLENFLSRKEVLLVLDTLEHLLQGVDELAELLASAPGLKMLVTSRERLQLSGEWVFEVQGLPVPAEGQVEDLEKYSAVQLFLRRARQARLNFEPSGEEWSDVVSICRMVEGMPLALELAAAWVPVLSCKEIATEIAVGLDILATRQRDVPERQRSLRAVFDHTWQLLTEGEQRAMCQLSLFRGGFGREAGEEIAAATLPLLSALVSKSLIRRTAKGRYDLHELIRQYAVEHLQGKPQLQAVTRDRYAAFYLALAEEADSHLRGAQQLHWLELLEQEHDNVRAVLEWALTGDGTAADSHVEEALQLAVALRWFWYIRGHFHEGRDWLTKLLQRCPSRRAVVCARALEGAGLLTNALGEHGAAVQLAEESIALFREMDDLRGLASGLTLKGAALRWQGFVSEGNGCLGEALAVHRDVGDRWGVALNLWELGRYLADFGGDENGEAMLEESARILEELGDRYTLAAVLVSLGVVAIGHAEYAMARTHLERSLTMCREIGDPWHTADALSNLGYVLRLQGDFDPARNSLEEALRVYQEGGSRVWELDPLCALAENDILQGNLADADWRLTKVRARPEIEGNTWLQVLAGYLQGILSYYQGDTERAAALLMEAKTMAEEGQYKPDIARLLISLGRVMITRHAQREAAVLLHEGLELFIKLGHKLGVVSALEGMAELPAEDATGAVRMLATAEATRKAIGAPLPPVEHPARAALLTEIRARLSEEAFARAWAEGTAMSLEETATNALAGKWPV